MSILDTIINRKREEVALAKERTPLEELENRPLFTRSCFNLREFMLADNRTGIIAEFKKASPSKGIINNHSSVKEVAMGYDAAGASAISVLTDREFFGGSLADLSEARETVHIPLLRKEFMIDPYQIAEAKAYGADIILLIAAVLSPDEVQHLACYAKKLGLNVLLEVHNREELDRSICDDLDAIGVNNRNLNDFTVSVQHSLDLVSHIPDRFLKVSESGISDPGTIQQLKNAGFNGILIGENFMKADSPAKAIREFCDKL